MVTTSNQPLEADLAHHPRSARRQARSVRRGTALVALLLVGLLVSTVGGCSMHSQKPTYDVTASLPRSVLEDGTLHQISKGGAYGDSNMDVSIPFLGYESDDSGPVAHIAVGAPKRRIFGNYYDLHVGDSVEVAGVGTVTLVSFDRLWDKYQAITILFKPEADSGDGS